MPEPVKGAVSMGALVLFISLSLWVFSCLRRSSGNAVSGGVARRVVLLALCAALAAALQAMPVVLPGVGMVLALFSTLPVCMGTLLYPQGALALVMVATGLLVLVHVEEATVFLLTTGPLGVTLGWAVREPALISRALVPGLTLSSGIVVLSFLIGLPALGPAIGALPMGLAVALYLSFGLAYSWTWFVILWRNRLRLRGLMVAALGSQREPGRR